MGSILGPQATKENMRLVVDGFHGHAHNRGCQVDFHPQYIVGNGRSDHAGCERVFDSSNDLAATTRHASRFHRQQAIEQHFGFWDEDKYAQLSESSSDPSICAATHRFSGNFMFNHYREALKIIKSHTAELAVINVQLGLCAADYHRFLDEERKYLHGLKKEPEEEVLRYEYVAALEDLSNMV